MSRRIDSPGPLLAGRAFPCSLCPETAGTVRLHGPEDHPRLQVESFVSSNWSRVGGDVAHLAATVVAGDAAGLFAHDREAAPFWCPECAAVYCGAHWRRHDVFDDDGWHDSIRGTCPRGHDRMLED